MLVLRIIKMSIPYKRGFVKAKSFIFLKGLRYPHPGVHIVATG
jgi:hypothetical protein